MVTLLLAALLLQETPVEFLKKVEDKVAESRTLAVDSTALVEAKTKGVETKTSFTGVLKSKGDGQAWVTLETKRDGKPVPVLKLVSDGTRVRYEASGQSATADCTLPLGTLSRRLVARAGIYASAALLFQAAGSPKDAGLEKRFEIKGAEALPDEKAEGRDCRVFLVKVASGDPGVADFAQKVWIDRERQLPVKRVTTSADPNAPGSVTEVYSVVELGAEIPDDVFKIPGK